MTPREGTTVADRYRLIRKVGGGPVAAIWQVYDELNDTTGAVKLLSPAMHSHAEALTRFSLEERISRELQGPYFAERLGSGSWKSMRYLAWKWHEGESLRTLFERTQCLDAPTVHSVIQEACAALSLVHAHGYAHADIKPENLFFADANPGEARQLKLFGFGIAARAPAAKKAQTATGRRRPGQILGTPLYMCPETIMGHLPADARADLWALAVVAYEALTGRPPFLGADESEVFRAILERSAPAPTSLTALPMAVDTWWSQVMNQEFHTTAQLTAELGKALRPALRSSHTQRSARGMKSLASRNSVSPALVSPAQAKNSGQTIPGSGQAKPSVVNASPEIARPPVSVAGDSRSGNSGRTIPQNFSQTVSGTGEGNPLATALLALRKNTKNELKPSSPSNQPLGAAKERAAQLPDPPFVPLVPTEGNFRIDARKTLVGLTPLLLTPAVDSANEAPTESNWESSTAEMKPGVQRGSRTSSGTSPGQGAPANFEESSIDQERPQSDQVIQPQGAIDIPASPTLPFPLPGSAPTTVRGQGYMESDPSGSHDSNPGSIASYPDGPEPMGAPTVVMTRPDWMDPVGLNRVTESKTFQLLVPSRDRREQIVAATIVCSAAAMLMAIISLATGSDRADLESTSLAAHPKKAGSAEPAEDTPKQKLSGDSVAPRSLSVPRPALKTGSPSKIEGKITPEIGLVTPSRLAPSNEARSNQARSNQALQVSPRGSVPRVSVATPAVSSAHSQTVQTPPTPVLSPSRAPQTATAPTPNNSGNSPQPSPANRPKRKSRPAKVAPGDFDFGI